MLASQCSARFGGGEGRCSGEGLGQEIRRGPARTGSGQGECAVVLVERTGQAQQPTGAHEPRANPLPETGIGTQMSCGIWSDQRPRDAL